MKPARFLWLLLAGCSLGHPGREQMGDEAWHAARWTDAVDDYRAAGDAPRVTAKLADAELQAGMLAESAQAWTRLGRDEPGRAAEAAAGLARVAYQAEHDGKQPALADAVLGLRQLAPAWPLSRLAERIDRPGDLAPAQAVGIIPALLSVATSRESTDTLLLALARADQVLNGCHQAVPILEGVLRRNSDGQLRDSANVTLGRCELTLGLSALDSAHASDAERWFDRAAQRDGNGAVGRRALIGVGDARARQGDSVAARQAWQAVATGQAAPDSITQLALLRLQQSIAPVVDSGIPPGTRP